MWEPPRAREPRHLRNTSQRLKPYQISYLADPHVRTTCDSKTGTRHLLSTMTENVPKTSDTMSNSTARIYVITSLVAVTHALAERSIHT